MIFYEAPHHLKNTLKALGDTFGLDRQISLVREISKIYEEVLLTTIGQAIDYYEENLPRGEFALIVAGKPESDDPEFTDEDIDDLFHSLIAQGKTKSEAAKETAKKFGLRKNDVYERFKDE
jgi:16S rRNA (cytidine1402-2'-O)-methyltransferase